MPDVYRSLSVEGGAAEHHRSRDLDALRAIAVLMVVAGHAYLVGGVPPAHTSTVPREVLVNAGGAGIWLFFALSGYLIAKPWLTALRNGTPLPDTRAYAIRRAARILPAYLVAFVALTLLVPPVQLDWWQPLLHGALLHNLVPGEGQALFFVAWTLGIEALFYTFVPLAAHVVRRLKGPAPIETRTLVRGVAALWALSVAWAIVAALGWPGQGLEAERWADVTRLSLPALLSAFCPGLLVALHTPKRNPWPLVAAAIPAAWLGMVGFTASSSVVFDLSHQAWSVAAGLLLIAALNGWRAPRLLAPIGLFSYGLFLWHWVVVKVLLDEGTSLPSWPERFVVVFVLSVPLALASWLVIERPLLRRTAGWWTARRARLAEARA